MSDDDVERQPLLQGSTVNPAQNGSSNTTVTSSSTTSTTATTVSPIGPDELPPPYSSVAGGVQMVSCRVCSNMIDISGKKDQVGPSPCTERAPLCHKDTLKGKKCP